MATQTLYPANYAQGFPGMVANTETRNVISRNVQDVAGLAFGVAAFQGTRDDQVTGTPGTRFIGISVMSRETRPLANVPGYAQFDTAGIMTQGVIWVMTGHAVVVGEPAFVTPGGAFTDVANGDVALPGAVFDGSAPANSLVRVRLG